MSIPLEISPRIMPSIASLYNDTNRIFMEYIDNSLDSAEECFDTIKNEYKRPIVITLKILGQNYKSGIISITDNCEGIKNFTKVVKSIGDSQKRGEFTTNGQFGYGIYSFMAASEKLEITSKVKTGKAQYLPILRSQFDTSKQADVKFPNPTEVEFNEDSGTNIVLSKFDKEMWKAINCETIKSEIEKHFELMLSRKNLKIVLIENDLELICTPFEYDSFEGETWDDKITSLNTTKGTKMPIGVSFPLKGKPIYIYLKITKGRTIDKYPVFIIKGRRIAEVKDVKSFKSSHKGDIWAHPNLTGYIDLGGFLSPTIARTDFSIKGHEGTKAKAVFAKLFELEDMILDFLKDVNKKSDEKHYKELEDELNKALAKLARIDNMNFRTELAKGTNTSAIKQTAGDNLEGETENEGTTIEGSKDYFEGEGKNNWEGNGNGQTKDDNDSNRNMDSSDGESPKNQENQFDDDPKIGSERKRSGFNIEITERDPDIDIETNEELRSNLIGGTIIIFKKHKDFMDRVDKKRTGESKITPRLITYLAGEITVHYKDQYITREGQPAYNKRMFSSVVHFIYKFEEMLSGLIGKNLGDISNGAAN